MRANVKPFQVDHGRYDKYSHDKEHRHKERGKGRAVPSLIPSSLETNHERQYKQVERVYDRGGSLGGVGCEVGTSRMCQQQLEVVVGKQAWLEDEMLQRTLQEISKDRSNSFTLCRL